MNRSREKMNGECMEGERECMEGERAEKPRDCGMGKEGE